MCDSCCNTSKTDNISRVLVISFIKLVTVTGNLLGTALSLAAAHGDTAEHSLSVLSSVAKYAIIPLLLINAYVFKTNQVAAAAQHVPYHKRTCCVQLRGLNTVQSVQTRSLSVRRLLV